MVRGVPLTDCILDMWWIYIIKGIICLEFFRRGGTVGVLDFLERGLPPIYPHPEIAPERENKIGGKKTNLIKNNDHLY